MKQSRLFGIVLTVALAVLFFTAVTPAVVSAATIYVPEGGNQTIQQAVNNASAGDTIIVRDGTYHENVDVGVAHLTTRSENGSANCIVNASDSNDHIFAVTVSYVNISGFTVENATGEAMAGIYLGGGVEHCNISDNTASNNRNGIYLGGSLHNLLANNTANLNDYGIYLSSSNYNNLTNNTASHNNWGGINLESSSNNDIEGGNVSYNNNIGIYIIGGGATSYNNVTGVLVTGNANGIVLENEDNCVIKNNTLDFNTGNGIYVMGWESNDNKIINNTVSNSYDGINLEDGNNLVEDNNVNNNDNCGIYIGSGNNLVKDNIANDNEHSGIQLLDCSDNEIIGNIANNNYCGISMWMWSNDNHNITSNTLSGNDCGIYVEYCGSCNISNNTVSNNRHGISAAGGWDSEITCNWVHHNNERGINVACTGYNISLNNIMFNGVDQGDGSYHWNFYNDQGNAVDAKNNYWVAMDNDTIDKSIYDGDPGEGGGKVTFYPFETGPVPCAPIPELATVVLFGVGLVVLVGYVRIRRKDKG